MPGNRATIVSAVLLGTKTTGKIDMAAGGNLLPAHGQSLFERQAQDGEREHPPVGNDPSLSTRQRRQATRIGSCPEPGDP